MKLKGLHHITMITGDAQRNVDFYAGVLGLRLVKQTVNFDAPDSYHLYFADEDGSPGSILTWFEFVGARPGRPGAGMVHTIELGLASPASVEFWEGRLERAGHPATRIDGGLKLTDCDGLSLELVAAEPGVPVLRAWHPDIPTEHAIIGVEGARAYAGRDLEADRELLTDTLGFEEDGPGRYLLLGGGRRLRWTYDRKEELGTPGAGTVHHIAWHSSDDEHVGWQQLVRDAGMHVTPVIDRDYFRSIYFRQPQGILFEIATTSPGFAVDEDLEHLGEGLRLPAQHEHLRERLERQLTPLTNPRSRRRAERQTPATGD